MNKRKTERYLKDNFVEVRWKSKGGAFNGVAVNLSRKGIDICCLNPPEVGAEITVLFEFEDEKRQNVTESIRGKVQWVKKLGLFHSGIEFISEIDEKRHLGILSLIEQAQTAEDEA